MRWHMWSPPFAHRAIERFSEWFESPACVWQTLVACFAIFAAERAFPNVDRNNFGYLLALTVYSSVTQPALAHSAARANQLNAQVLRNQETQMRAILAVLAKLEQQGEETHELLEEIQHGQDH